jgi:hypothetical protein
MKGLRRQAEAISSVFRYFHSKWKFGETKSKRLLVENYKYFIISVTTSQRENQLY